MSRARLLTRLGGPLLLSQGATTAMLRRSVRTAAPTDGDYMLAEMGDGGLHQLAPTFGLALSSDVQVAEIKLTLNVGLNAGVAVEV